MSIESNLCSRDIPHVHVVLDQVSGWSGATLLHVWFDMLLMMFAGMLAAVCAFPQHRGKIPAASTVHQDIYPSIPGAASPAASTRSFSFVTPSYQATGTAIQTALPSPSASGAPTSGYSATVVAHHNAHRANHSAPEIVWDDGLAATAQKIAESCIYAHDTYVSYVR